MLPASGESEGASRTNGSSRIRRTANGPSTTGIGANDRSNRPVSTARASSAWSNVSSGTSAMPGRSSRNRLSSRGSTLVPTLCMVPTRSVPRSPARMAAMSAWAASSRATTARACTTSDSPTGVSRTRRGPPGRSSSGAPTARSRLATCWLTADWV